MTQYRVQAGFNRILIKFVYLSRPVRTIYAQTKHAAAESSLYISGETASSV